MTLTEEEESALSEFAAVAAEWRAEKAESDWRDTMRQCRKCHAWVNRHLTADVVSVCPNFNLCEGGKVK